MRQDPARARDREVLAAVRALQAGDGYEAFRPIFLHYYRPLHNFFANQPVLRVEADDLVQETLVRAFQKIHQFKFESSFGTWLRQIAQNVWRNAVRDRQAVKRGPEPESLDAAGPDDPREIQVLRSIYGSAQEDPEQRILVKERDRVLHEALEELPPAVRRCVELRVGLDLQYNEIACLMGIELNTVRSQLFQARKRLRGILDDYFGGADL